MIHEVPATAARDLWIVARSFFCCCLVWKFLIVGHGHGILERFQVGAAAVQTRTVGAVEASHGRVQIKGQIQLVALLHQITQWDAGNVKISLHSILTYFYTYCIIRSHGLVG